MDNSPIKAELMRMGTLPSVPVLYWRIMDEINSPKPSIERVAEIGKDEPTHFPAVVERNIRERFDIRLPQEEEAA